MGIHCIRTLRRSSYQRRDKTKEDTKAEEQRDEQRYDREKKAFADKYRKKIEKENRNKPRHFDSVEP